MLIQALTQQFQSYFDGAENHTIALRFDPDREYEALLPHLTGVALWCHDGSLLRLRYRLIQRAAGEKTVVYLGDDLRLGHLLGGDCQILAVAAGFGTPKAAAGAAGRNDNHRLPDQPRLIAEEPAETAAARPDVERAAYVERLAEKLRDPEFRMLGLGRIVEQCYNC